MVDEKTIKETLTMLKLTYPNSFKDLSKEEALMMIKLWCEDFKNTQKELFIKAINNLRNTSTYLPNVAMIKKEIANIQIKEIPKAEDEWLKVLQAVRRYGSYREKEALESLEEYTSYITRHIGYQNICSSEDQTWNKKEFIEEYEVMKDKEITNLQIGNNDDLKFLQNAKEMLKLN